MKNKAQKLFDAFEGTKGEEFKILIEDPDDNGRFNVHLYLEGVLTKVITGVKHYHIQTSFGDDAE